MTHRGATSLEEFQLLELEHDFLWLIAQPFCVPLAPVWTRNLQAVGTPQWKART